MKKLLFKLTPILVLTVLLSALFNACTKVDLKTTPVSTNNRGPIEADAVTIAKVKAAIEKSGKTPGYIIAENVPATDVHYMDANDKTIDLKTLFSRNGPDSYTPVCDYQTDGNGDPIEDMLPLDYILGSFGNSYGCTSGTPTTYNLSFNWFLAIHQLIVASNLYGTGGTLLHSRYTFKVKNSGGSVIATYSNVYIMPDNIHDDGAYLIDPTRELFQVGATFNMDAITYAAAASFTVTVTLTTNCNKTPQLSATFAMNNTSLGSTPCLRTDEVYINGNTGTGGVATAAGTYIVCTPATGITVSPNHELQYRKKVGTITTWDETTSTIYPTATTFVTFSTYTGIPSLPNTTVGSGTWLIRFRNKASCTPTAPWVTETYTF